MALGEGSLRTMELTERVPGYSSRTIYRYSEKLAEMGIVEREEEPGVPSKVVHSLADPCGSEIHDLVRSYAEASLNWSSDGRIDAHSWAFVGLLADLWESGMAEELSCEARSPTELAQGSHGLSYHQVNRRAALFEAGGLLCKRPGRGRRRCYALTEKARRAMTLITGIGRWRHHHVLAKEEEGMTAAEMATVLRASLQLVKLPDHAGACLRMGVLGRDEGKDAEGEAVWAEIEADGTVHSCVEPPPTVDAWARGGVSDWTRAILDGKAERLRKGGKAKIAAACLAGVHRALWEPRDRE